MTEIEIIARGVCIKGGQLLLCHGKGSGHAYLPGGHVEFGETSAESLRREIAEEIGAEASVGDFLGVVENSFRQGGEKRCEINLVFLLDLPTVEGRASPPSREPALRFSWHPMASLSGVNLLPAVLKEVLPRWLDDNLKLKKGLLV